MAQINRLQSNKANLLTESLKENKSDRLARTRTLIQLGGLVKLSGLLDYCQISLGTDLQIDPSATNISALLLGILVEAFEKLPTSTESKERLKNLGIRILKQNEARKYFGS